VTGKKGKGDSYRLFHFSYFQEILFGDLQENIPRPATDF
jgi:hypothetical protein